MLAVQPSNTSKKCTPNLLPMRINHNGRIEKVSKHWTPTVDKEGVTHAYFRGRHLHGTTLALPPGYTGAVLNITETTLPRAQCTSHSTSHHNPIDVEDDDEDGGMDVEDEEPEDVKIAEQIGDFDDIVVWGHGGTVEEGEAFLRGVREWVGFAGVVHCDDEEEGEGEGKDGKGGVKTS